MDVEILTLMALHVLPPLAAAMIWHWLVMAFLGRWEPYLYFSVLGGAFLVAGTQYLRNYTTYAHWSVAEYYELAGKTQMLIFIVLLVLIAISYVRMLKPDPMVKTRGNQPD
ncbi:MAG: hypothetical protein EA402_01450 [Planctomycetota bacterium]|nr:MAG: hypothetical protein EA402_01450 [Planctomycetota bacterium]